VHKTKSTFFSQTSGLVKTILSEFDNISKPAKRFISTLCSQWWTITGRYNFINLSRFMTYSEQAMRNAFSKGFDFASFNWKLIRKYCSDELILAFDPSFIHKSGKQTEGLDYYWSGQEQKAKKGLEFGCLAVVDIKNKTAFHLNGIQTPSKKEREKSKKTLIGHYLEFILSHIAHGASLSKYLTVDGYFMKKEFILPLVKKGIHIITKMRSDANLKYLYKGKQHEGKGRKRKHAEKVNLKQVDRRRWTLVYENKQAYCLTTQLFCVALKMNVKIVYLFHKEKGNYEVFLSTDINLTAEKIEKYYRMRYQIEFLFRDGKQHSGFEDCQARSSKKLNYHLNLSLTNIGIAKAEYYLSIPAEERKGFTLENIKRLQYNKLITDSIFSNLDLDLSCEKIKALYDKCINIGRMAA
jgi:hypothetical protein